MERRYCLRFFYFLSRFGRAGVIYGDFDIQSTPRSKAFDNVSV